MIHNSSDIRKLTIANVWRHEIPVIYEENNIGIHSFALSPMGNGPSGSISAEIELKFEYNDDYVQVNVDKISNFWEHNHRQYCAKPGTLILWDARMLHSTMPNYTDEKRRMLLINAVSQTIRDRVNELDPIWSRDAKMLN